MATAQEQLDAWIAANPGSNASYAPLELRESAWVAAGAPDYSQPTGWETRDDGNQWATGFVSGYSTPTNQLSDSARLAMYNLDGTPKYTAPAAPMSPPTSSAPMAPWQPQQQQAMPSGTAVSQQTGAPSAPTVQYMAGGLLATNRGAFTEQQLKDQLTAAGYGGPWDAQSMVDAYNRAGAPTNWQQGAPTAQPGGGVPGTGLPDTFIPAGKNAQGQDISAEGLTAGQYWEVKYRNDTAAAQQRLLDIEQRFRQEGLDLQRMIAEGEKAYREAMTQYNNAQLAELARANAARENIENQRLAVQREGMRQDRRRQSSAFRTKVTFV